MRTNFAVWLHKLTHDFSHTNMLVIAGALSPIFKFLNTYVFNDWEYLKSLVVICTVDTVLGAIKAYKKHQFGSKGFGMVFNKIVVYGSALITSHVLVAFTVHKSPFIVFSWVDTAVFSAIMVREAISVFENIAELAPDAFPTTLLKRFKGYNSITGMLEDSEEQTKTGNEGNKKS